VHVAPPPVPVRPVTPAPVAGYVNPFAFGSWSPARIDQGVDWIANSVSPVVAIGSGVVTYSSTHSGWPDGAFIAYRLTSGSHAGLYIYVAEHLINLLPAGTPVRAGQVIATALPGSPFTEWGFAAPSGPVPASSYSGAADGTATAGGRAFARFLIELGAGGTNPGPGPDRP
jgi:murein DD-endopeptidase MepM/ murein hydrolase activator NlpD